MMKSVRNDTKETKRRNIMKGNITLIFSATCVLLGIVFMVMAAYMGMAMFPAGLLMFVSMLLFFSDLGKQNAKNIVADEEV